MGALDLLLKKLFAPKKLRCILVSVCAVFFLILTNFAASAVRSVLMLLAVYMSYLFSEDDDTVTALFVSVFLITLFSPNSVYDLGMWMSFFATLGLVTVYPLFDKYVPRVKAKNKMLSVLLRFCRGIGATVTLTLVANFFLLPIMWYFFGSISVSAIPANLLLSPLSAVYLPLCAIAVVLGWIPFLNKLLVLAASVLGRAVLFFVDFFADIRGGVLSLRYTFVTVIVILFSVALAVLLIVKLKHKLWIASPAVALVIAFSMSLLVYNLTYEPSLKYINRKNNEILLFENGRSLSICDISSGSYSTLDEIYTSMPEYAVEIENFVLTHAHRAHVGLLERFIVNYPIRTLYLPLSNDKDELENITAIYLLAQVYDTDVKFYESGKEIALFDNIAIKPYFESNVSGHNCIYVNASDIFTYSDLSECDAAIENGAKSAYFLLGTHGEENLDKLPSATVSDGTKVIFANNERGQNSRIIPNANSRVAPVENGIIKFKLPLE
jgi:ComEC/Rec2-related protein